METLSLLQTRTTAGYKPLNDAIEILNIQEAFNFIVDYTPEINKTTIKELHQILSKDLLPKSAQGKVRDKKVYISGSDYIPLSNADQLEIQMDKILQNYHQIKNPFDKAIYIHNNVAYLQYFQDCNKRLSRILQNLSLIKDKKMILSFTDLNKKKIDTYKSALIAYYEKSDEKRYKKFFIKEQQKNFLSFPSPTTT
ncbi:hypothetical protein CQA57_03305 [Helicobacter anseris]|uniref:Fido domain-containing protein n=1 Tax=Helicobacter anseris TaxID=375926 RepID=A0A3D8J9L4_9HELI|nr:Fic family protein [Helicobacter anseris]RDU74128.1 hypothetical protein CQA57_03305 [Helicobacter anseris]